MGVLVGVCALWGTTFVVVKHAIEEVPPFEFLAIRFGIAFLALVAVFPRQALRAKTALPAGLLAGCALAAGYGFQTTGLQLTSATNAGYVTGLFVVLAPIIGAIVLRRFPPVSQWLAVAFAFAGLSLLTLGPGFTVGRGDVLVLGCAASFAVHIVLLGRFSPLYDPRQLAIVQLAVAAAGFLLISLATEVQVPVESASVWWALLLTSIGASAIAFLAQTWAQIHLDPTQTAVTLTSEPVFAGLAGFVLLGERLTARGWLGATLILGAMLWVARQGGGPDQLPRIRRQPLFPPSS